MQGGSDWPAIAIQIAVATLFSGVIAYVATNPQQLAHAVAENHAITPAPALPPQPKAQSAAVQGEPVQVKNPFDATEVFQFASGTSETDAQLAVASLLLQRARDRQHLWAHIEHRSKKRANHVSSDETVAAPASLSPRLFEAQATCRTFDRAMASEPAGKCS